MRTLLIVFLVGLVSLCAANERKQKHTTQGFRGGPVKHPEPALYCINDEECQTKHDHPCKVSKCDTNRGRCYSEPAPDCPTDDACPEETSYCPSNWRCVDGCDSCPHFPVQAGPGQCGQRCLDDNALCRETHRCVPDCGTCRPGFNNVFGVCRDGPEQTHTGRSDSRTHSTSTSTSTTSETTTTTDEDDTDDASEEGCRDKWNEDVWMQITMAEDLQRYALALQLVYKTPDNLPQCAVTLLAPTDAAFARLPEETYYALFTDMELLKSFVELSIIPDERLLSEVDGKRDVLSVIMETKYTLREENAVAFFVKAGEYCVGGPSFQDFAVEYNVAKIDMAGIMEYPNGNILPISDILIPKTDGCSIAPAWPHPRCAVVDPDDVSSPSPAGGSSTISGGA